MRRFIRTLLIFVPLQVVQLGCGGSTEPSVGTVRLRIASGCTFVTLAWDMYVDFQPIATAVLAPGQSHDFAVATGTHSVRVIRQSPIRFQYDWSDVVVTTNQATELNVTCQL